MAKVQQIGSNEATGIYDYYASAAERYKAREYEASDDYVPNSITTGLPLLDRMLYQKVGRNVRWCSSWVLRNQVNRQRWGFSINATLAGYNVLYLSLEVHTSILDRFDARLSETEMSKLVEQRDDVHRKLAELGATKGVGNLWVERPSGSMSPADLDRMLNSMKANGMIPDMVVVDYADLMRASYDLRDDRANIRSIYTDLRALYDKHNVAGITASQTNREGGSSEVATMMHAADNIEKSVSPT
ncbi:AAA family ATPase [Klebsiella pneumoniae]|uniref:AAA family ATPase n=1 Tax=Klebsiella pneumoniae TaxID=573 RepID=UPI00187B2AF5|nr:AAA family ATPase [Klebsiella pneumoniae]